MKQNARLVERPNCISWPCIWYVLHEEPSTQNRGVDILTQAVCMHVLCAAAVVVHGCVEPVFVRARLAADGQSGEPRLEGWWDGACVGVGQDALDIISS